MNRNEWQQVKKIFDAALKLTPDDRGKFLDENCDENKTLRREVENLLDSFANDSFMEQPAAREVASLIIERNTLTGGETIAHYEIIEQLGAGGMGEVYLAHDNKLDRRVALKILNDQFSKNESNLRRFIREAKAASALNHPNILVIHEIGESEKANFIVSEYVEGETLREIIGKSPIKLSQILDISTQIASALAAAHSSKIVHRDIKPENVVVRPDGFVKVLDFGLAKLIEQKPVGFEDQTIKENRTAKGLILGTVNYMSPEQAKGEQIDERTDIFSLGVLIYETIAGRTPFAGDSVSETLANLINTEPQPLGRFVAHVPIELQRIVTKTLRKKRDERYQTISDLLLDLKDLRENLAFDEHLEKSHAHIDETATVVSQSAAGDSARPTSQPEQSVSLQTRWRKSLAAFVVAALIVGAIGISYYFFSTRKAVLSADGKKSIAVLPFVNAGQDPNAEYLSDGITESIINHLSQLSSLKVMSRNSAFRFKDDQSNTKLIASQLGVETLVTGEIKQIGDQLVINVRLIDPSDDSQIWGNQFVKSSADFLSVQNEIAQAVAQNLRLKLTSIEKQQLGRNDTENIEAYQLYLRGRFHVFKLTPPEVNKGISYLQQAINIDPNYALAYAGLSDAYRSLVLSGEWSPTEFLPKAKAAAQKAIEIDDRLSEGHTSLGMSIFWYDWDWDEAENQFRRALELNPNEANAHVFYAHLLSNIGRHQEALAEVKQARELDPLSPFVNALEAQFQLHGGHTDEALIHLQKTFDLDPNFWLAHHFASSAYIEKEMYTQAIAEARKAGELSGSATHPAAFESYALAKSGRRAEAQVKLKELLKLSTERLVSGYNIALIYNGLDDRDNTFRWLDKAFEQRDPKMAFLKVEPKWKNLHTDPRFVKLLQRMNFDK